MPFEATYDIGCLPAARTWLLGFDVTADPSRPTNARLDDAVLELRMTTPSGDIVIHQAAPLHSWQWWLGGPDEKGVGPSFVYRAGGSRDIPLDRGGVRVEPVNLAANGGWGTYFRPNPDTRHRLTVRVLKPDADGLHFSVRLKALGSNYGGSL